MAGSVARFMKSPFVRKTLGDMSESECSVRQVSVPTESNYALPVRIYTPGGSEKEYPVLVMAHSGGFCTGDLRTEEFICRFLCRSAGLIVVDVDYRLAPEHDVTVGRADVYAAVRWVSRNAHEIGASLSKGFLVGGVSAGGCHTISAIYEARDEKISPPITGVLIISMGVVHILKEPGKTREMFPGRFPSHEQNKDAPFR